MVWRAGVCVASCCSRRRKTTSSRKNGHTACIAHAMVMCFRLRPTVYKQKPTNVSHGTAPLTRTFSHTYHTRSSRGGGEDTTHHNFTSSPHAGGLEPRSGHPQPGGTPPGLRDCTPRPPRTPRCAHTPRWAQSRHAQDGHETTRRAHLSTNCSNSDDVHDLTEVAWGLDREERASAQALKSLAGQRTKHGHDMRTRAREREQP